MSLQQAKNALVASLFELSNAATEAATATVNFYKAAGIDGDVSSLTNLSESINGAVQSVFEGSEAGKTKPKAKKALKAKGDSTETEKSDEKSEQEAEKPEKVEKPKRKRAEKDPNAPKKPLTSYLRFNLSVRDQMRKERLENGQPTYPATELNQIIADRWATLGEEGKAELQKAYESEFEVYKKALEQYNKSKAEGKLPEPKEKEEKAKEDEITTEKEPEVKEPKKKKTTKKVNGDVLADGSATTAAETNAEETPKKTKKRKEKEGDEKKTKKKKNE